MSRDDREAWLTFYPEDTGAAHGSGFGVLVILDETRAAPDAGFRGRERRDAEVVTYVLEGAIAFEDDRGSSGVVEAGEFRRMTAAHRIRYRAPSAPDEQWVHVFQIGLRATGAERATSSEQRRFTLAERRGVFCTIASPDGLKPSLHVHEDAQIFSSVLDPGQHVVHELLPGRSAWVHVVEGDVTLAALQLHKGDGAGITAERSVSITARTSSEILLVDIAGARPLSVTLN